MEGYGLTRRFRFFLSLWVFPNAHPLNRHPLQVDFIELIFGAHNQESLIFNETSMFYEIESRVGHLYFLLLCDVPALARGKDHY
jgi:hypothetical protein